MTDSNRWIATADAHARTSAKARLNLATEIARLEGAIESEGGLGLSPTVWRPRASKPAGSSCFDTLEARRAETSAKFVGLVAKCVKRSWAWWPSA